MSILVTAPHLYTYRPTAYSSLHVTSRHHTTSPLPSIRPRKSQPLHQPIYLQRVPLQTHQPVRHSASDTHSTPTRLAPLRGSRCSKARTRIPACIAAGAGTSTQREAMDSMCHWCVPLKGDRLAGTVMDAEPRCPAEHGSWLCERAFRA